MAAAAHQRDLAAEQARLAGEGVEQLEQRLAQLRRDRERERREAQHRLDEARREAEGERAEADRTAERERAEVERRAERELAEARQELGNGERRAAEARERLEAQEKHLANAQAGIEARDRRLEVSAEKLEALQAELETRRREAVAASARLELREEELERTRSAVRDAQGELVALRERLAEKERDLALRERDLEARVGELGQVGEELVGRERELDAAGVLLETQGAELAQSHEALAQSREAQTEAHEALAQSREALTEAREALAQSREALTEAHEATQEAERERDEARARLEVRERHLDNAKHGIEARDHRLEVAEQKLEAGGQALRSRDAELERLRAGARGRERKLALAEARLEKAEARAEHFRGSLVELRGARSYRLMRILWRIRRPFRRAPREEGVPQPVAEDDADPAPPPAPAIAIAERKPPRPGGERLRVASILDEMSQACFAPECELVPLSLEGWAEQLDEAQPDLLLVESAWNANGGAWQYRIAEYPRKDLVGLPALRALLDGCRERGIATAFWNKEDPVHFDRFAEAAGLFDHVFTTDARCVERYRALPGERTVTPLPFAAQPRIHNPIATVPERSSSPCFAGAWYRDRHADRRRALEGLLDAARPYGLVIYDRRFGAEDDAAFGFPDRFAPHVLGKLPYERILDVYKSHRVFLNANSVVDSPTMCSRRVFELAACDTAILSTPGAALAALLGEGTVEEAGDEAGAAAALERLLGDEGERRRRTRAARRAVFAEHTYAARLATIAEAAGLDASSLRREPIGGDRHRWQLILAPGVTLSKPALEDLAAATTFADADVIGIGVANGAPTPEHRRVSALDSRALLLRRELTESRGRLSSDPEQIQTQLRAWSDEGVRLYAADADLLRT